ncbi:MAG: UbiX family flavin prenyltransferase [Planctomycetota bacterium]|jgi:4-hydroxy-3-polyprenylbenzoate decarboxylase|nr:MAG: UbiX family flavin prenyltransferase [Planctomycetota bacterium]
MKDLVVALTGASGSLYGLRLVEVLIARGRRVHLTISPAAVEVFHRELDLQLKLDQFHPEQFLLKQDPMGLNALLGALKPLPAPNARKQAIFGSPEIGSGQLYYHHFRDYSAGIASGSFLTGGMVICPCSMGTLASLATGQSQNLVHRAADVHLKERRKLIVVPRETPLSLIALENMKRLAEAGAVILPAMPGFYNDPVSISDLIDFVVARICDQLGVDHQLSKRWGADASQT